MRDPILTWHALLVSHDYCMMLHNPSCEVILVARLEHMLRHLRELPKGLQSHWQTISQNRIAGGRSLACSTIMRMEIPQLKEKKKEKKDTEYVLTDLHRCKFSFLDIT
ncbi:hypothetical protein KP509_10G004900 [Ceratopteris richardii]|uniref:Uncharacterized protein n=1 Tax=Ceratopteris richardii TaxID=49495 RepID=A0A8T2TUJ6_CERRI|nr:hypothetical protein KP509_10G004900 [Ceratopteris richardii]